MAMSRRKQLHPKSLKEGDEPLVLLPDELKFDEQSNDVIARVEIEQGHRFGPFAVLIVVSCQQQQQQQQQSSSDTDSTSDGRSMIAQIDNETTQGYQLLDAKHNWLARCSSMNSSAINLNILFENEQIMAITNQPITIGSRLCTGTILLPKTTNPEDCSLKQEIKTNEDIEIIKVKQEPIESDETQSQIPPPPPPPLPPSSSNIKTESSPPKPNLSSGKKLYPLVFACDACGIRYSNRSTLDAHRKHYCTKRENRACSSTPPPPPPPTKSHSTEANGITKVKSMKRKPIEIDYSSSPPTKRISSITTTTDSYCSECDILFSKPDNLIQHKLHYCRTKNSSPLIRKTTTTTTTTTTPVVPIQKEKSISPSSSSSFRPPIPFDRPIQIGQFIYIPVPIVTSTQLEINNNNNDNSQLTSDDDDVDEPLDLSKPKATIVDECQTRRQQKSNVSSAVPLDLSIEKSSNLFGFLASPSTTTTTTTAIPQQTHSCDYCSIRFSSLKTLHAHQENYCGEFRKQKKNLNNELNEIKPSTIDGNRSQSPSANSKVHFSSLDSLSPPHRSSPFMCRLCKYRGNTLRGMRMHFKFHLSNNEPCTDDDIIVTTTTTMTTQNSLNLLSTSSPPSFLLKCTICAAMFDHDDALLNHVKRVHINESILECSECQSRFSSKWNLLRHMRLTHTNMRCEEDENNDDDDDEMSNESLRTTNTDDGEDRDLSSSSSTDKHSDPVNLTGNGPVESMDISQSISTSKTSNSSNIIMKKKFACPYCHIKFGSVDTLKQHMMNYCSARPIADTDTTHITKKKNTGSSETYCSSCQIPFRHKSSYEAHKMYYCRGSGTGKTHVQMQA